VNTLTNRIGLPATGQQGILSKCNGCAVIASAAAFVLLAVLVYRLLAALPVIHLAPVWAIDYIFAVASLAAYPVLRVFLSRGGV
jgi:hypothetical protein